MPICQIAKSPYPKSCQNPSNLTADVGIGNVVCQVGIATPGVAAALEAPVSDVADAVAEWERRRNTLLAELDGLPVIPPHGGWYLLMDCQPLGLTGVEASARLLTQARVATTAMGEWGSPNTERYLRFVFTNETSERLKGVGQRVGEALT